MNSSDFGAIFSAAATADPDPNDKQWQPISELQWPPVLNMKTLIHYLIHFKQLNPEYRKKNG